MNILLSAAVGAVVVRWLLRDIVGRELSYSAILLALVAGSAVGSVAQLAAFAMLRGGSSAALGLSLLPEVLAALVSYSLLSNAARELLLLPGSREFKVEAEALQLHRCAPRFPQGRQGNRRQRSPLLLNRETVLAVAQRGDRAMVLYARGIAPIGVLSRRIR